jgi:hypothetical protein
MKRTITLLAAGVIAVAPTIALSAPPSPGSISPNATTGQPGVECDDGTPPGNAGEPHGSSTKLPGSPFVEGDSVSGTHYAGEQPQNSKNTTSVSQYDIACFRGPDRPSGG